MNYVPQLISGSLHLGIVCSSVPIEPQEICISCGIEMNKSTPQFPYLSLYGRSDGLQEKTRGATMEEKAKID